MPHERFSAGSIILIESDILYQQLKTLNV